MTDNTKAPCRKCGDLNPVTNDYCRHCGAVLEVSTMAVKAQPKPVLPVVKEIKLQYVLITAAAMLGLMTILLGGFAVISWAVFDIALGQKLANLGSLRGGIMGASITVGSLFLLAFGLGGFGISWLARRRSVVESMISTTLVLALFTVVGLSISEDTPIIAIILFLPSVAAAGIGSKIGMTFGKGEKK